MSQSVGNDYRYGEDYLPDGAGRAPEDLSLPGGDTYYHGGLGKIARDPRLLAEGVDRAAHGRYTLHL